MRRKWTAIFMLVWLCGLSLLTVRAEVPDDEKTLLESCRRYQDSFAAIETREDIEENGHVAIAEQSFPVVLESFGEEEVVFLPIMDRQYHRLALLILDNTGKVLFKTNQLETNNVYRGKLEQPTKGIAAVAFQDLNGDGKKDIVLITNCRNMSGEYAGKAYKVGDVLFQGDKCFYRDWRISDKINRFNMNRSAEFIISYVRDGYSTEILYTATTMEELLDSGFEVAEEQRYYRSFEKLGLLEVVPGSMHIAHYEVFMIYLVNEQGDIVWSFQPMGDYDNLYALKGITCRDMDGDGMKDIVVLARYSYAGSTGKLMIDTKCSIYYQRTSGFEEDREFSRLYRCTEEDTVGGLVEIIRDYWGWTLEND